MNQISGHKVVLIIDDDKGNCMLFKEYLQEIHITVISAHSVLSGCKRIITDTRITHIFVGIYLNDISEIFRSLKFRNVSVEVKIYAIITDINKKYLNRLRSYMFDGYLLKPIVLDELLKIIEK